MKKEVKEEIKKETKNTKGIPKVTEKKKANTKKPTTGRGISMKNWIFIIITVLIAFGAGYYFSYINSQSEIKNYKIQIEQLEQKQDRIKNVIENIY